MDNQECQNSEDHSKCCKFFDNCSIFKHFEEYNTCKLKSDILTRFCCSRPELCARYMVYKNLSEEYVPYLMLPHQMDWAKQILLDRTPRRDCRIAFLWDYAHKKKDSSTILEKAIPSA